MRKLFGLILSMLCALGAFPQEKLLSISPNYRLYPSSVNQTEVFITKSPIDENILFASCNTLSFIPFFVSEGIYVTMNGGQSWYGSDTCKGNPIAFHGGDPGIAIDKDGTFILTRIGRSPFVGLYSHYSTDNGLSWSDQKVISTDDLERATVATDINPLSPFYGRTYAAWVRFAPPYPLMLSYTDDGAQSWSTPQQINNPSNRSAGGDITIGPDGQVYVCWAGVTEVSPFREIYCGFAASTDGGQSWTVNENAFPMNGITGILENKANIRVNGLPNIVADNTDGPRRGRIYIVTGEKGLLPAGSDPDIIMHYSDNDGQSWSSGIRVNRDEPDNGKIQYFPGIDVDATGALNVIFYDDRNSSSDSAGVMLSRTTDGGQSWAEYEISDHNFKPSPIGGLGQGYQGDNIDIVSAAGKLWPVWMDNATGVYQVWTAPVEIAGLIGVGEESAVSGQQSAVRVYPNPFSTSATISYRISERSHVTLKIHDLMGNEVAVLVDEMTSPGEYSVHFRVPSVERPANGKRQTANGIRMYYISLRTGMTQISSKILHISD